MVDLFKKIIAFLLTLCFFTLSGGINCSAEISASSAIVTVFGSGEILYEKNPRQKRSMASTTKIMTAILALESGMLDREITATKEMVTVEGTSIGLLAGDKISLRELVWGMLLQSGNDAANAVAVTVGGSVDGFVGMMNDKAKALGMVDTHFVTPSGLDADGHYTTAYDMALLTSYCLKNEEFVKICSSRQATLSYGNPPYKRTLTNHNKLLQLYDGAIGVKTGFTKKSGRCLVSAARRDGLTIICVTLNSPNDWDDHSYLLDCGFANVKKTELIYTENPRVHIISGEGDSLSLSASGKAFAFSLKGNPKISVRVYSEKFAYAPVKKGDVLGEVCFYYENGEKAASLPLTADSDIKQKNYSESKNKGFFKRITDFFKGE